ncbi:MAG: hypothetical protein R2731_02615 [Nocardioides sp.]
MDHPSPSGALLRLGSAAYAKEPQLRELEQAIGAVHAFPVPVFYLAVEDRDAFFAHLQAHGIPTTAYDDLPVLGPAAPPGATLTRG